MRRPTGNYLVWFTIRYHCHLLIKLWQCRSPHPRVEEFQNKFAKEALIFQSTSVAKPEVNDLPFAAGGTEIEKVRPFFL
jgi:hypothetical protein